MEIIKVNLYGEEREKDEVGRFKCLLCGEFNIKKKPGTKPNKYCTKCGIEKKTENLKKVKEEPKGRQKIAETVVLDESKIYAWVGTPAGDSIPVKNEEEKKFYEERRNELLKNYDFSGAELDMLKTFLQLSLEEKRLERISLIRNDAKLIKSLLSISDMKVKVQESLGLSRDQRIERTQSETVEGAIETIIQRFKKIREDNNERFVWKCKKCGSKNIESRMNPEAVKKLQEEKLNDCTPIETEKCSPITGDGDGQ